MVSRRVLLHLFILTLSLYPLSVMSLCRPTFAFIAWKLIQKKTSRPPDCPANAWNRCRLCLTRNWKRGLHFSSSEPLATFLLPHPPPWENHLSWCPTNKKDQTNLTRSSQPPATLPRALLRNRYTPFIVPLPSSSPSTTPRDYPASSPPRFLLAALFLSSSFENSVVFVKQNFQEKLLPEKPTHCEKRPCIREKK